MFLKKCRQCGAEFSAPRQQKWCSPECMLEGRSVVQNECWIWPQSDKHQMQVTWRGEHMSVLQLLSGITGKPLHPRSILVPTCGTEGCVNPRHFHVEPAPPPNPKGFRGKFTPDQIRWVAASQGTVREVAKQIGCSSTFVHRVRTGRFHSDITGIKPKARR